MLAFAGRDSANKCVGPTRRSFLQAGTLGVGGLTLADRLRLQAQGAVSSAQATAVILVWLDGGPTHLDTYDLKPNAPVEYRGPFVGRPSVVPGLSISECLPAQARVLDKLTIVKSLHHTTGDHFAGAHWMLTGHLGSTAAQLDPQWPSAGSLTAKIRGANQPGLPAYVAVPFAASVGLNPGYNSAAYLGTAYNPFQTGSDPNRPDFSVQNLRLPTGISLAQLEDRKLLLSGFDQLRREVDQSGTLQTLDQFQREAYELISGPAARAAFDISKEDPKLRDRYGRHNWGQSTLLARRLVEAGVTFVTVHMGGWDDHANIEQAMKNKLPIFDHAIAALVEDLVDRGMYERVALYVCGEFGRTPRVNSSAGRDHWGQAGFALLGGGGLRTGFAYGSTSEKGEYPKDRPVAPQDLLATLYSILGIDTSLTFQDRTGRPHPVLSSGQVLRDLL